MGYWVNTVYVHHDGVADIAAALEQLFAIEGMSRVELPERKRMSVEPLQYDSALHNDIWGVAIFPGAPGWTVMQTAPLDLLAEPVSHIERRRISLLCERLSASALIVNVHDSSETLLAECSPTGEVFLSGWIGQPGAADPYREYIASITEEDMPLRFRIHESLASRYDGDWGEEFAAFVAGECAGENASFCDNLVSVDTLVCRKAFVAPGGRALHFQWSGPSRQRYQPSASSAEYYASRRDTQP
jgi:hypothetical protein